MPEFSLDRAREFIATALDAPLFQHVGEPFDDENVVRATTLAQYRKAMRAATWGNVVLRGLNYRASRIIEVYGPEWFQNHNNESVQLITGELDRTPIRDRMDAEWQRLGLPREIDGVVRTQTWAYNHLKSIAYGYGLGFDPDDFFERKFVEAWLLRGHLPCGWKGRLPPEPEVKATPGVIGIRALFAGLSLQDLIGDGKLVVF